MHILYLADIRFPLERANGIQTMETCHALARRNHIVQLVVRPDSAVPPRDPFEYYGLTRDRRLIVEPMPPVPPAARRIAYLAFAAGRALGRGRGDILMTRDLGVASLVLTMPAAIRPPVVYESHGYAPEVAAALPALVAAAAAPSAAKLRRLAKREQHVWKRADGYVAITAGLASALEERFGARQGVAVIPDGTRLPQADLVPQPGTAPPGPPVVAYAGHLYAWKGVDVLLEALARVPAVRAVVAGGHPDEADLGRTKAIAARLGLEARVTFTGLIAPREVPDLLAGADILALPNTSSAISTRYTSPLKLFEYMAAGRAIVASDLPSIREVLVHEQTALLVPAGDAAALGTAIERLAGDPALRLALGRGARDAVAAYTWDRRAERLEDLFNAVRGAGR